MSKDTAVLDGKTVAITGASSGIGEATALACAEAGALVALGARRADRLASLVERIEVRGGRAIAIPTDITDENAANNFINQAHSAAGRLDVLINNAGVMLLGPIHGAPTEEWRRMIGVNVMGPLYCTHAALPLMTDGGHIINVSSLAGKITGPGSGVYSLTKFGLGAFTEALRQETMAAGIRVTLIEPGHVDTELGHHLRPEIRAAIEERLAVGKPLDPADLASAILFALTQPDHAVVSEIVLRPRMSAI